MIAKGEGGTVGNTENITILNSNVDKIWDKTYGGSGNDDTKIVIPTQDGGFLLGGNSNSSASGNKTNSNYGDTDYWIIRLNANGDKLWDRTFGGIAKDELVSVTTTSDGGFLLAGNSTSSASGNKSAPNYGGNDYWLVKINANGDKVWDKSYGGNNTDWLYFLIATPDGSFLIGGDSISPTSGNKSALPYGGWDYWVVKINGNGDKLWDKSYGGSQPDGAPKASISPDGGILLCGYAYSPVSGNKSAPNYGNYDIWLVKITTSGDKLWDKSYGGSDNEDYRTLISTQDGGFLLGGHSLSPASGNKSTPNYGDNDFWVVKINGNGDKLWDKTFGGSNRELLESIVATPDGGFLLGGHSLSPASGNKTILSYGGSDYWVVKINNDGDKIWEKAYGGSGDDWYYFMIATKDGGFLLGGDSSSMLSGNKTVSTYGNYDMWVVKINDNGDKIWDKTYGGVASDGYPLVTSTLDGGYLLWGYTYSAASGNKVTPGYGYNDFWLVKIK
ncbi:lipoprotein [Nibrella saemangeumensis]|uniref:Lipoprotein n=2 Tax=Nibrella saemangeumensis TaxID=1084526 RepID=A0ABP8MK65_9BACT